MSTLHLPGIDPVLVDMYIKELGEIGLVQGKGLSRFLYDKSWIRARDVLLQWMGDAGLESRVDAVGNVFGRIQGREDGVILTGSHIDTVPSGGRYDGALGVVGGLAALAALRKNGTTPTKTLEVVALCEEESSRFQGNFLGTRAILGLIDEDEPDRLVDRDGNTLASAMVGAGLEPGNLSAAKRDDVLAFIELHIEQGRILYDEGVDIGVVDVITGLAWETVKVIGRQDHAGSTPMDMRKDAFQASAEMAREVTRMVEGVGRPAVVTTGSWSIEPGWPSIVPGAVEFSIDLRHPDSAKRQELLGEVRSICTSIAEARGVSLELIRVKDEEPAAMNNVLVDVCRRAADACEASWRDMHSGAGHDSQVMASRIPTAMMFVPSVDGRSHTPDEFTSLEDCARGASVLAVALQALAYG